MRLVQAGLDPIKVCTLSSSFPESDCVIRVLAWEIGFSTIYYVSTSHFSRRSTITPYIKLRYRAGKLQLPVDARAESRDEKNKFLNLFRLDATQM